ncbi:MAG: glycosyltransferase family 4 protein, partial [Porticoccaceae bacterium]|nr:glycosyltransferase family 4 protein [Porticoccaceae bacterium]
MKLAFVLYRYFPFGGLQRNMLAIAKEAQQRGHEITVYCTSWDGDKAANISVDLISRRGWSNAARMTNFADDLSCVLATGQFDLVVGFNKWPGLDLYYAADSCFAYKAYRERGFWYRMTPRAKAYLAFETAVFGSGSDTDILEVSTQERARFIEFYRTPSERFHTLPPGISRDRVAPENWAEIRAKVRKELGVSDQQKVLLAVGSGFRTKGLDRSIAVLKLLSDQDVQLFIIGDDKQQPFMKLAEQYQVQD